MELLDCPLVEIDILISNEVAQEPIMVVDNINYYHMYALGYPTGVLLHPSGSERQKKFADYGRKLVEAVGPCNGVYCVEVF